MTHDRFKRFSGIGFEDFRRMALDPSLSLSEKVGFPDEYRAGKEQAILNDIVSKVGVIRSPGRTVLDIGPGCSVLAHLIIDYCRENNNRLLLADSQEMLDHLSDEPFVRKFPGYYPECADLAEGYTGKIDCILCYSVLHYVFAESNLWRFLDVSLGLLAEGGMMLFGDIPNISKRKRFFSSLSGIAFHKQFMQTEQPPELSYNVIEKNTIDDAVIIGIILRARSEGFDAYILPQDASLPMANRREDILIVKP